jgi:hypothetical protein
MSYAMKTRNITVGTSLLLLCGLASGLVSAASDPVPCSLSVGVTTRTGTFRTWTNALVTFVFQDKGLDVCQDDAVLSLTDDKLADLDEAGWEKLLHCQTQFRLELLYHPDQMTRNITITYKGKELFDQDYPNSPASQKILKTIPSCSDLQKKAGLPLIPSPAPTLTPLPN